MGKQWKQWQTLFWGGLQNHCCGESNGNPLQYCCLKNPMDRGAWWAAVHGVPKSLTWLNDFTFTFHFHALEKEMATHSSVLAWRIPGTAEPGGLQSMGSHTVGHDWNHLAAAAKSLLMVTAATNLKDACSLEVKLCTPRQCIKKQRNYSTEKTLYSQSYVFSSSYIWMWELDHKEGWMRKNWCLWTVVLEKTLESPLDCKEIKTVNPKGNQFWIFIRRTGA